MGMGGCERKRSTIRVMAFAFGQVAHCSNKSGALPGNCETGVPYENVIRKLGRAQIPCSCVEIPCSFKKFPVLLHREFYGKPLDLLVSWPSNSLQNAEFAKFPVNFPVSREFAGGRQVRL